MSPEVDAHDTTDSNALASITLALISRLYRLLEVFCNGYIHLSSPALEYAYIKLRRDIARLIKDTAELTDLELDVLEDGLPPTLAGIDGLIGSEIWDLSIKSSLDAFIGSYLSACVVADIVPFNEAADGVVRTLGYDELIGMYEAEKQSVTRRWLRHLEIGQIVPASEAVSEDASTNEHPAHGEKAATDQLPELITGESRTIILLWREGKSSDEIGKALFLTSKTILNKISQLRIAYGEEVVPRRRKS